MSFRDRPGGCRVAFDCKPLKYPNTGLFYFCRHLSAALAGESLRYGQRIQLYIPRKALAGISGKASYRIARIWDKIFFLCTPGIRLWHCSHQLSKRIPHKPGLKVLTTVHDLNFLYEELSETQRRKRERRFRKVLKRSDAVVCISGHTLHDLQTHYDLHGKPAYLIYNGCCCYTGPIQQPAACPSKPFLFSVGTVLPKKNFHVLPCLLRGNDYELLIAGNLSPYAEQIRNEAAQWGVSDRVRLLGPVEEAEKHWYLRHCTAFLFPSIAEGFGLPVIEAMQYGKPVFLSRHTCLPEIGREYACYFNRDFDPALMQQEFREGMLRYRKGLIDPEAVRQYARSFSWEKAAKEYWKIYRDMQENDPLATRIRKIEQSAEQKARQYPPKSPAVWQLVCRPLGGFLLHFIVRGQIFRGRKGLINSVLASYEQFCLLKSRYEQSRKRS